MSRSKHTDPLPLRARRRLRAPWERRSAGDLSLRQKIGRRLKESGISSRPIVKAPDCESVRPRIVLQPPRLGFLHPAGRSDVLKILELLGSDGMYGLRSIEFLRTPETGAFHSFGHLEVPGRIMVYEQPLPPWHIPGAVAQHNALQFIRSGADMEYRESPATTIIDWPKDTLREFMLFDVILHEVGHHILQHNKGKKHEFP